MTEQFPQPHSEQPSPLDIWGGVTDPAQHSPEEFRYLVHAINPIAQYTLPMADMRFGRHILSSKATGDQKISMFHEPERVAERVSLSTSLVDAEHTATWGNAGLIVEAPAANIAVVSPTDAGTLNGDHEQLAALASYGNVMSGDELLEQTSAYGHNEVVVLCARGAGEVALKGFFYKTASTGEAIDRQLAARMQILGVRHELPVIAIDQKSPYAENGFEHIHGGFGIRFGGESYSISGSYSSERDFFATDEFGNCYFASPDQIANALAYAVDAGEITEAQAAAQQERYREADKQRAMPHITFADNGDIRWITQMTGYGASESRITIDQTGKGTQTNIRREAEDANYRILSGKKTYRTIDNTIPQRKAGEVIEAACESLDEETALKVRTWYDSVAAERQPEWRASRSSDLPVGYSRLTSVEIHEGHTILDILRGKHVSD